MKNSLQDRVRVVRIYDNVIRIEKRFDVNGRLYLSIDINRSGFDLI